MFRNVPECSMFRILSTAQFFTFVFSITFIKSVASLRCGFCDYDIGCSSVPVSTKEDSQVLSVGLSDKS